MTKNLFKSEWEGLSDDLRLLLEDRIGRPGQISGKDGDNRLYLPLAAKHCKLALQFSGNRISAVERGPAFDAEEWSQICAAMEALRIKQPDKFGRDFAFSRKRVLGWWRGGRSGVQILPPPAGAPTAPSEMAEHPFILEFPLHADSAYSVWNNRRLREHRKLALLLNLLLTPGVSSQRPLSEHVWVVRAGEEFRSEWLQRSYLADPGHILADALSAPIGEPLEALAPDEYYETTGYDGSQQRVPADLDDSICRYRELTEEEREKFDRALFWLDIASRQWTTSFSASFASLAFAIESLIERGHVHRVFCPECGKDREHDVPGATALFRNFLETNAPGLSLKKRRDEMYALRSGIVHGDHLIAFDEGRGSVWDPPWFSQRTLQMELWSVTRVALRNYLRDPGIAKSSMPDSSQVARPLLG